MNEHDERVSRIAGIMTSVWTSIPPIKRSEVDRIAEEVALRLERGERQKTIEDFLAKAQNALWIEPQEGYRRIAYRARQLV